LFLGLFSFFLNTINVINDIKIWIAFAYAILLASHPLNFTASELPSPSIWPPPSGQRLLLVPF
jgi:hypothetical protein